MSLPPLHRLSLSTNAMLRTSEVSKRIRVPLAEILQGRVERFRESVESVSEDENDRIASLEAERVFLRDVLLEYTVQRAFDCVCLHPPIARYVDADDRLIERLQSFLQRAEGRFKGAESFSRESLKALGENLDKEADLAVAILDRLATVWTVLHQTPPEGVRSLRSWADGFRDALSPLWTECRMGPNVKMFDGPRDHTKELKVWWASEVGRKQWTPDDDDDDDESEEDEDEEQDKGDDDDYDKMEAEGGYGDDARAVNLCPNVYAYGLYSGAIASNAALNFEHVIPKSWCNTTESILELEQCIEDASLIAIATKSRNTSRSNNLLPLLLRDEYRRSLFPIAGLWKPLPMRGFTLMRRALAARITARGFLAYPFLQPPTLSYEGMEASIVDLTASPHFSTHTKDSERKACAVWEIGLSLLLWRELGAPFNVLSLFAHTTTEDPIVDAWRPRFDALLRLRLQERDAFRALLLAHAPALRVRTSLRAKTSARDYGSAVAPPPRANEVPFLARQVEQARRSSSTQPPAKKSRSDPPQPTPDQYMTMEQLLMAEQRGSAVLYLDNARGWGWKEGVVKENGKRVKGDGAPVLVADLKTDDDKYLIVLKP